MYNPSPMPKDSHEPRDAHKNECIYELMLCLWDDSSFQERLEDLRQKFPPAGTGLDGQFEGTWSDVLCFRDRISDATSEELELQERVAAYYDAVAQVAQDYGLNPEWALEYLHILQKEDLKGFYAYLEGAFLDKSRDREYHIVWEADLLLGKEYHKKKVLHQFDDQWEEEEKARQAAGFMPSRERGSLEEHMRWVFERVCLKRSWNQLAEEESCNNDTIRKAVEPIRELLGLRSPKIRGGRPRK